jgi:hypothetical protein
MDFLVVALALEHSHNEALTNQSTNHTKLLDPAGVVRMFILGIAMALVTLVVFDMYSGDYGKGFHYGFDSPGYHSMV